MKTFGIILNPKARINSKRSGEIIRDFKDLFGDSALVSPISEVNEIESVIREFSDHSIEYLLISGGDGTICTVLSSYINVCGDRDLPVIVPLRGGTINMIGTDAGLRSSQITTCKKLKNFIDANMSPPLTERGLLKIREGKTGDPVYGFTWIDGLLFRFMDDYYKKGAGAEVASMLALRYILVSIADTSNQILDQVESAVYIDGKEMPHSDHAFIVASSLKKFVFGFNIFDEEAQPGESFNSVYMRAPYLIKSRHKIPLGLYKSLKSDTAGDFVNKAVKSLRIEKNKGYIIDGEIFRPDEPVDIIIESGPKLNIFSYSGHQEPPVKHIWE